LLTWACFETQCLSTLSTRIVAAVDMTDSFLLLRSLQLPRRLIASPTLHREPLGITCTGGVWSLGLLEAEVAIANAAAADDVLDLQ
jgi:hypothetical protein